MSNGNLTFSLVMKAVTEQFNSAVKQAKVNYEQATDSVRNGSQSISSATSGAGVGVNKLSKEVSQLEPAAQRASTGIKGVGVSLTSLQGILASVGLAVSIKQIADAADAYKNLESRIKLVTGEGANFQAAFDGVQKVALSTNSSLESTGNLFSKIAAAGKALGISQAESLKITETINQAIQLSGASAQASDAAITQLIQALQSGVLRGDEFNSIMEQAPRLSTALAASLGVTTGELRKMAEAGQLSSDIVIKALQSQAGVIKAEFATLPETVGRAIQNLKTNFEIYIGEVDKANGVSAAAARAINALSENLDTIANVLKIAAEAAIAYKAVDLASSLFAKAQAATAASLAIRAEATALGIDTIANVENATATRANAAAKTQLALASTASGASVSNAGRGALSLTGNLATLGNGLVGVISKLGAYGLAAFAVYEGGKALLAGFTALGTSIGEYIAKLSGVKSAEDLLAESQKRAESNAKLKAEQIKASAQYTQDLTDKTLGLNKESKALVASFEAAKTSGDSVTESLNKINSAMKFDNTKNINDAVTALEALRLKGSITADDVQKSLAGMLKGVDLQVFQLNAQQAFDGTANSAKKLAVVMEATLAEAIRRTGLDVDDLKGQFTAQANSAINDVDTIIQGMAKLKQQGIDVQRALTASIGSGLKTADSQAEVDALTARIKATRDVLGDKIADGLLSQAKQQAVDLKAAFDAMTPGINSAAEAMKVLGVVSDKTLKNTADNARDAFNTLRNSGTASTRELSEAFKKYAADAITANGGVASAAVQGQAAMYGLEIQSSSTGDKIVSAMDVASTATARATSSARDLASAYKDVGQLAQEAAAKSKAESDAAYENKPKELNKSLNAAGLQHYSEQAIIQKLTSSGFDLDIALQEAKNILDIAKSEAFRNPWANLTNGATVDFEIRKLTANKQKEDASKIARKRNADRIAENEKYAAEALKLKQEQDARLRPPAPPAPNNLVTPSQVLNPTPRLPASTATGKTINVNFILGGKQVAAQINSNDESSFLAMLEQAKGLS
jgi:tape measure domain-containing protein